MAVTCYYSGRFGNCVFNAAMLIAYAKKHDLKYFIPTEAKAYNHFRAGDIRVPFYIKSTGERPSNPVMYREPGNSKTTNPSYHEIPKMDNVIFEGYYQSFLYFDWCRDHILETFDFPVYPEKGMTAVHIRRGDCVGSSPFPMAPREYYQAAIKYIQEKGFNKFRIYSDDMDWVKGEFIPENYPDAEISFMTEGTELSHWIELSNCENQITARSTFSLTAAWFNRNPDKIVCVPTTRHPYWRSVNKDLIPPYFTQIDFEDPANTVKPI